MATTKKKQITPPPAKVILELEQWIAAGLPATKARRVLRWLKLTGTSAEDLYLSTGVAKEGEEPAPHFWLVALAVTNPPKAAETLIAWLRKCAEKLPEGDAREMIFTLRADSNPAECREAVTLFARRRKAGAVQYKLERAFHGAAQFLITRRPLDILMPAEAIMAHCVVFDELELAQVKQELYTFLREQVSAKEFNPTGLK